MLKILVQTAAITASVFIAAQASAAEKMVDGEPERKLSTILHSLSEAGYTKIEEVEREHGFLFVEGINNEGAPFKLKVDAKNGKILSQKTGEQPKYSVIEVIEQFESEGQFRIIEVELDDGIYKIKAKTTDNKKRTFRVDAKSGERLPQRP